MMDFMQMIRSPLAFPVLIMGLFAAAAIRYGFAGNWSQAGYHACAAGLQLFVMGMSK